MNHNITSFLKHKKNGLGNLTLIQYSLFTLAYLHVIDFLLLVKFSMIVYTLLSILEIELHIFNTIYPLSISNLFWIFSLRIKSKISMIHKYPFLCFEESLNSLNNVSHKYLPLS